MSNEHKSTIAELLKYPLAALSIFLALVGAKHVLEIPFDSLSKITKDGIEFRQEAKGELASLAAQLHATTTAIEEIKRQLPTQSISPSAKSNISEASETVPEQTARIASVETISKDTEKPLKGFIWIGDYNKDTKKWLRTKLISPTDNSPVSLSPEEITPGTSYSVSANMVLRDGLPPNTNEYFQARRSLGVVPLGKKITMQATPTAVDRGFATQYWAEISFP
jgi:hypothetical protein